MKKKKNEELPIEDRPLTEEEWDAMGPWMQNYRPKSTRGH